MVRTRISPRKKEKMAERSPRRCCVSTPSSTRRCGSVHLGVVVLSVCEVCNVCEGYVGSAVVLCI